MGSGIAWYGTKAAGGTLKPVFGLGGVCWNSNEKMEEAGGHYLLSTPKLKSC
jgi:hypothetical protein